MTMLRRWVPAGILLSSVVASSSTLLAQTAPTKTGTPTAAAKPATSGTAAKPATGTASAAKPPTDPKTAAPATSASATAATPDPKGAAPDVKAAATPPPATDADKEVARLLDDARKNFKAGQIDKAREQYTAAYKLKPEPATLLGLAQAEAKSNRARDAAEHLEQYLREAKSAPTEDRQTAQKVFEEVTAKLATWYIKVNIDGAELFLNGKSIGKSPLPGPVFVDPNTYELEAKKEGFKTEKEMLVASPNTESESMIVMNPVPVEEKPKPIQQEKPIPKPAPPLPKWYKAGLIGGGALTALGLGLGIGLTVSASGKGEEADAQLAEIKRTTPTTFGLCGTNQFAPNQAACGNLANTLSSQDARANGAIAGFVIAGVGAVGTVGLIVLPKLPIGRKLTVGMKIAPVIGLDRLGGTVTGSF